MEGSPLVWLLLEVFFLYYVKTEQKFELVCDEKLRSRQGKEAF